MRLFNRLTSSYSHQLHTNSFWYLRPQVHQLDGNRTKKANQL